MQIVIDIPIGLFVKGLREIEDIKVIEDAIKNGTPLPKGHGFIAICDSEDAITEEVIDKLKDTVFIGDEECSYCFDIVEIIEADKGGDGE